VTLKLEAIIAAIQVTNFGIAYFHYYMAEILRVVCKYAIPNPAYISNLTHLLDLFAKSIDCSAYWTVFS